MGVDKRLSGRDARCRDTGALKGAAMIRIQRLKLPVTHTEADLKKKIEKTLRLKEGALLSYSVRKQSLDARKKPELYYVYTVDVKVSFESRIFKKIRDKNISSAQNILYQIPAHGSKLLSKRPVVVGSGPAGLFCAYLLAEEGYRPLLIERGMPVEIRLKDVQDFWKNGNLKPESNTQFGEGGAGTFSDGKLNTLVKDKQGRSRKVLEIFVKHGAPGDILYVNKPHIGSDILINVVRDMREYIIKKGGEIRFHTKLEDIRCLETDEGRKLNALFVTDTKTRKRSVIETPAAVLAIGHSARDTFHMLHRRAVPMEAKSFAVGVRVEHPQKMIDRAQYGMERPSCLAAASYKLTEKLECERGVYTFCMCPGGYVINASSEEGRLAVNGMSYRARDGQNANSAVIVTVSPEDFKGRGPLSGIDFQRYLEERAYRNGFGKIPIQLFGDFCRQKVTEKLGAVTPQIKGSWMFGDVRGIFPDYISEAIEEGILAFDRKIPGFAREDAVLSAVESRTSSPVRILRNEEMESEIGGLYPCGEGAGYAGGITSAAMDGLKTAEAIVKKYRAFDRDGE